MRINKKEPKFIECCLKCSNKLHHTAAIDMRVCMNSSCESFEVFVTNWYNFEE